MVNTEMFQYGLHIREAEETLKTCDTYKKKKKTFRSYGCKNSKLRLINTGTRGNPPARVIQKCAPMHSRREFTFGDEDNEKGCN